MFHIRLPHSKTCYECFKISGTGSYFSDHIAREQKFQCNKCGYKFAEENSLEDHIFEGHEFTCEDCNATFGNDFHFEYHKYKYHESSLQPPAVPVDDKCEDEGDSKSSVGKEPTKDSAQFDEPMLSYGSNEEILPISVLNVEKEVHN